MFYETWWLGTLILFLFFLIEFSMLSVSNRWMKTLLGIQKRFRWKWEIFQNNACESGFIAQEFQLFETKHHENKILMLFSYKRNIQKMCTCLDKFDYIIAFDCRQCTNEIVTRKWQIFMAEQRTQANRLHQNSRRISIRIKQYADSHAQINELMKKIHICTTITIITA